MFNHVTLFTSQTLLKNSSQVFRVFQGVVELKVPLNVNEKRITSLHPLLVMLFLGPLADPFRFAIAIPCPSWLRVAKVQALRRILDLDHQPICGPTTRTASRSCNLIWPKYRSTVWERNKKHELKFNSIASDKMSDSNGSSNMNYNTDLW